MQARELRNLSDADLAAQLDNAYKELFNLRFRLATLQLTNHRELPRVKRTVARIRTIMRERELARQYAGSPQA
ncbi:MAG: 50S ribosomal protein L29 [Chloroflexi bacterium]|nr:50S ribosomal protein L29 [Chloroflexota bacterium]